MSDFGIFNDELGGISSGHTALTLWEHGWGKYVEDFQAQQPLHVRWEFTFPPISPGKIVLFFLHLEDNSNVSCFPICIEGNKAMVVYNADSPTAPYFYVYTTDLPSLDFEDTYGIEVYNNAGDVVFNSNTKTMNVLGVFNTSDLSKQNFSGKGIACSSLGTFILNAPAGPRSLLVVTRYLSLNNGIVRVIERRAEKHSQNPAAEGASFNRYFGMSLDKTNLVTTIIDVSNIKRKPK